MTSRIQVIQYHYNFSASRNKDNTPMFAEPRHHMIWVRGLLPGVVLLAEMTPITGASS